MAGSQQVWLVGKGHGIWKKLAAFNLYEQDWEDRGRLLGLEELEQDKARTSQEWKMVCAAVWR